MKISIVGDGEVSDDHIVHYVLCAENSLFKGTYDFYGYADNFEELHARLMKFPFESKERVIFVNDELKMTVSLYNLRGAISFRVAVRDHEGNSIDFADNDMETEALHKFANKLNHTDFSKPVEFAWSSDD